MFQPGAEEAGARHVREVREQARGQSSPAVVGHGERSGEHRREPPGRAARDPPADDEPLDGATAATRPRRAASLPLPGATGSLGSTLPRPPHRESDTRGDREGGAMKRSVSTEPAGVDPLPKRIRLSHKQPPAVTPVLLWPGTDTTQTPMGASASSTEGDAQVRPSREPLTVSQHVQPPPPAPTKSY